MAGEKINLNLFSLRYSANSAFQFPSSLRPKPIFQTIPGSAV